MPPQHCVPHRHRVSTGTSQSQDIRQYLSTQSTATPINNTRAHNNHIHNPNNTNNTNNHNDNSSTNDPNDLEDPTILTNNNSYGDQFITKPHQDIFRVLGHNNNGIFPGGDMTFAPKSVFDSYRSKHASIVCMQEPNCDFKQ